MKNSVVLMICILLLFACTKEDSNLNKKGTEVVKEDVYLLSGIISNNIADKISWKYDFVYDDRNHLINYSEESLTRKDKKSSVIVWIGNKVKSITSNETKDDNGNILEFAYVDEIIYNGNNVVEIKSSKKDKNMEYSGILTYTYDKNDNLLEYTDTSHDIDFLGNKIINYTVFDMNFNKDGNQLSFCERDMNAKYDNVRNPLLMTGFPISLGFYLYSICFDSNDFYQNNISKNNCLEYLTFNKREVNIVSGGYILVPVKIRCENKYTDGRLMSSSLIYKNRVFKSFEYEYIKVK